MLRPRPPPFKLPSERPLEAMPEAHTGSAISVHFVNKPAFKRPFHPPMRRPSWLPQRVHGQTCRTRSVRTAVASPRHSGTVGAMVEPRNQRPNQRSNQNTACFQCPNPRGQEPTGGIFSVRTAVFAVPCPPDERMSSQPRTAVWTSVRSLGKSNHRSNHHSNHPPDAFSNYRLSGRSVHHPNRRSNCC